LRAASLGAKVTAAAQLERCGPPDRMSTAPIFDRKAAELRLVTPALPRPPQAGVELVESSQGSGEILERTVEAVVQVAGELARITAANNQAAQISGTLSETVASLSGLQAALDASLKEMKARDAAFAKTAERLRATVTRLETRHDELLEDVHFRFRKLTSMTLWTILFCAGATTGVIVCFAYMFSRL